MDLQQITVPLVVSFVVSVAVAILSFIVNVRVGKERSDRSAMRSLYKALHEHFSLLRSGMRKGEPKQWEDYPRHDGQRFPPARDLERVGDINLLPKHLAERFLDVEMRALYEAHNFKKQLVGSVTPAILAFVESVVANPYTSVQGLRYSAVSIGAILMNDQGAVASLKNQVESGELQMLAIGLSGDGKERALLTVVYITSERLTGLSMVAFVEELTRRAAEAAGDVAGNLQARLQAVEEVLPLIANRIRDPHPFAETASSLFRDMFDQSTR